MAILKLEVPFAELRGTLTRGGVISRKKMFRDENGRVIFEGQQEAYAVRHPRDWKKNPAVGRELECQNRFKAASAETRRILLAANPEAYAAAHNGEQPTEEALAALKMWLDRFQRQLRRAEPDAPVDPKTGRRKRYSRLDAFIRTCLMREMQ